jgi:hypothetical protein
MKLFKSNFWNITKKFLHSNIKLYEKTRNAAGKNRISEIVHNTYKINRFNSI